MALNFPANPGPNETYPVNGVVYLWDGIKWTSKGEYSAQLPIIPDENGNVIITGNLTVEGSTLTANNVTAADADLSGDLTVTGDINDA